MKPYVCVKVSNIVSCGKKYRSMLSMHRLQVSLHDITNPPLYGPLAIASINDCFVVAGGCWRSVSWQKKLYSWTVYNPPPPPPRCLLIHNNVNFESFKINHNGAFITLIYAERGKWWDQNVIVSWHFKSFTHHDSEHNILLQTNLFNRFTSMYRVFLFIIIVIFLKKFCGLQLLRSSPIYKKMKKNSHPPFAYTRRCFRPGRPLSIICRISFKTLTSFHFINNRPQV